ncbi:hypothetical protein Q8A67_021671 [Cirrhinus molitorella]|uniref:Uncharacterized protein n=1 Tax=Cirrhinus molitorella TaxID=172907 RepID=A0AA88P658_9TELE|nr:hypothetical protein Q8A67_021671 [Cirrhinus molitorella]
MRTSGQQYRPLSRRKPTSLVQARGAPDAFQFSVLFNDTRSLICRNTGADSNTWPISCTSDSSAMSSTVTTAMTRRTPSPARSPRMYIQTVSNLSLPPSPVSTTTSSKPSVAARAVRNS